MKQITEDATPAPAPNGECEPSTLQTPDGTTNPLPKKNGDSSDTAADSSPEPERETSIVKFTALERGHATTTAKEEEIQ
jgi:hypothetical protein